MNRFWISLVVLGTSLASGCSAQVTELPAGWVETHPPAQQIHDGNGLACANYSRHEWKVTLSPSGLQVRDDADRSRQTSLLPPHFVLGKETRGRAVTIRTSDGWLVGFDAGEFGGGLWWSSEDGSAQKRLLEENVHALIAQNGIPLVLTGLAHMGGESGTIYAYHAGKAEGSGILQQVADLGSSPGAASLSEDGTLFVVTQKNIVRFGKANKLEPLYASGAFAALYPNSIVTRKDGRIFVGMRFYILELRPDSHNLPGAKWYIRSECRTATIKDFDCVCTASTSR
jgi:hypothetical protein